MSWERKNKCWKKQWKDMKKYKNVQKLYKDNKNGCKSIEPMVLRFPGGRQVEGVGPPSRILEFGPNRCFILSHVVFLF